MSGKPPGSAPGRSRATLLLGLLAAVEALAIAALILSRPVPADPLADRETRAQPAGPAPAQFALPPAEEPIDRAAPDSLLAEAARNGQAARPLAAADPTLDGVGILLCGTVRTAAGEPIESAVVGLKHGENENWLSVTQGRYSVAGMPPGRWRIECTAEGFVSQDIELDLDASRPLERLDFVLDVAITLAVRFETPDGRALSEALEQAGLPFSLRAVATRDAPAPGAARPEPSLSIWSEAADPGGAYAGTLTLTARLPVFVSALWNDHVVGTLEVTSPGQSVVFVFPLDGFESDAAGVDGRFVDAETGQPVEDALVMLAYKHTASDATGAFSLTKVLPGNYDLKIEPPHGWVQLPGDSLMIQGASSQATYSSHSIAIELHSGERLHLGDVRLEPTVEVTGRVVAESGPLEGVQVEARPADGADSGAGRSYPRHAEPGPDGRFTLRLKPGAWTLRASGATRESRVVVLDARRGLPEVTLRLDACAEVRFELASSDPTRARTLVVLDDAGVEVHRLRCGGEAPVPPVWTLHLPAGSYACEVRDDAEVVQWRKAFVVRDAAERVMVPLN